MPPTKHDHPRQQQLTRLPLTLEAVFVSSAAEESSAIISERGKRGKLYGPGDMLPGNARLYKGVEAAQVILERAGAREALAFKSKFQAKANYPAQPAQSAANQAAPRNNGAASSPTRHRTCSRS